MIDIPADCPECGTKSHIQFRSGLDTLSGCPIASMYAEHYTCERCGYNWYIKPYEKWLDSKEKSPA